MAQNTTKSVLAEVRAEREHQEKEHGSHATLPDAAFDVAHVTPYENRFGLMSGELAKSVTEGMFHRGRGCWNAIFLEEVAEAVDEALAGNETELRAELVQVAAVSVAWIEALDLRDEAR